jgi:trehalose/maltose hydrolase-like predicted phosphorylase
MFYTPLENIVLEETQNETIKTFISSIDINEIPAKEEMDIAIKLVELNNSTLLYSSHIEKFNNIYDNGIIELDNNTLQSVIYSSFYYLYSSLPALDHYGKLNQFYGLSPGSMSRGALLNDYQGHSFWDTGYFLIYIREPRKKIKDFFNTLVRIILGF